MGEQLQRDQGARRQDQQQALSQADRGRPLLADHRPAVHRSGRAATGGGEGNERHRQRALHGARSPPSATATPTTIPPPSATQPGSQSTTRLCIRNIPAHTASAVRPWPPWARLYSAQPTYRKLPSPAPPPPASPIDGPIFTLTPTR